MATRRHQADCRFCINQSMPDDIGIIFTDLDGTLLNSRHQVSQANMLCLRHLEEVGMIRVIATGRSCFSYYQLIPRDFPADYLIFASGAGILDLQTGEMLFAACFTSTDISFISDILIRRKADFMVHYCVPDNHRFVYHGSGSANTDFQKRIEIYRDYANDFDTIGSFPHNSAQIIAVLSQSPARFREIADLLDVYQITRTTSPLDGKSIWMEIYPENVNKGTAAAWLCQYLQRDDNKSIGVGNDYNDINLLDFTTYSYMVANAPVELLKRYHIAPSNDEDGFSWAVEQVLNSRTA